MKEKLKQQGGKNKNYSKLEMGINYLLVQHIKTNFLSFKTLIKLDLNVFIYHIDRIEIKSDVELCNMKLEDKIKVRNANIDIEGYE